MDAGFSELRRGKTEPAVNGSNKQDEGQGDVLIISYTDDKSGERDWMLREVVSIAVAEPMPRERTTRRDMLSK